MEWTGILKLLRKLVKYRNAAKGKCHIVRWALSLCRIATKTKILCSIPLFWKNCKMRKVLKFRTKVGVVQSSHELWLSFWWDKERESNLWHNEPLVTTREVQKGYIYNTTEKNENAALFLRWGLLSTLIRHKNATFLKRFSNRRNLKTLCPMLQISFFYWSKVTEEHRC